MDEPITNYNQPVASALGPSDTVTKQPLSADAGASQQTNPLGATSGVTPVARTDLPSGVYDYSDQIAKMFDAQQRAKEQSLASAYEQNLSKLNQESEKIAPLYQTQANDLSTQYERNRRNMNFQADLNGLNTGTASQMQLAQNNAYMGGFGKLRASEAEATRAVDLQKADLEINYKNSIAQALADNDYQKATALMQEYQRRDAAATEMERYNYQKDLADAQTKAGYGDFSGYAAIYGQEIADAMKNFWIQSNPNYAYANGLISAAKYKKLTGHDAPDTSPRVVYRYVSSGNNNGGIDEKDIEDAWEKRND